MFANKCIQQNATVGSIREVQSGDLRAERSDCAIERQKVGFAILDDLDGIISRASSVSDRIESICDGIFGDQELGKNVCSPPYGAGLLGQTEGRLERLRQVLEALEQQTHRLEQLI